MMPLPAGAIPPQSVSLAPDAQARVQTRLRTWDEMQFPRRLWQKDYTLWSPVPLPELADRLGWLDLPQAVGREGDVLRSFADEIRAAGARHVVLLGMGGSSLAPEVFQAVFGNAAGYPELVVLDSTHPAAVRALASRLALRQSLFLVSSKSGTTTETLSLYRYFWHALSAAGAAPGEHFVAITDPGTPLVALAGQRGFRRVFAAPPDVGGRYSALSVFGLVPAALIGCDLASLADRAARMAAACGPETPAAEHPGLVLGAVLGEMALAGRDKVTLISAPPLAAFPAWIEQLIAESTGKTGKGIVPVCDEPLAAPDAYGTDRVFVYLARDGDGSEPADAGVRALEAAGHPVVRIRLAAAVDLAGEFFRWEVATAAAGAVLGIQPFDQPDVQLAKDLAQRAMAGGVAARPDAAGAPPEVSTSDPGALAAGLSAWAGQVRAGDYLGIQAYLAPTPQTTGALQSLRQALRGRFRIATTLGYGPRFLHSTGQLHKGGPDTGVFLQLVDAPGDDVGVPETDYTFGALIRAQALGDLAALRQRGRRVLRVNLGSDTATGLAAVAGALSRIVASGTGRGSGAWNSA
jgi:transaldolase/glucose-6-phosphate isomerase